MEPKVNIFDYLHNKGSYIFSCLYTIHILDYSKSLPLRAEVVLREEGEEKPPVLALFPKCLKL